MPFSTEDFKAACHRRATGVAVVTVDKPRFKAAVVTEHSAAFPSGDEDECYVTLILNSHSETLRAINKSRYFALNYLRDSQLWIAESIYRLLKNDFKKIAWLKYYNVPYLPSANASVICSVFTITPLGENSLVVGHVMAVHSTGKKSKPLVNHNQAWCSVARPYKRVTHPRRTRNKRLLKNIRRKRSTR